MPLSPASWKLTPRRNPTIISRTVLTPFGPAHGPLMSIADSAAHSSAIRSTSTSLLTLVKAKDDAAWSRFVELYSPLLYGWCRRHGVAPEDASDVVQDVFSSVSQNMGSFRGDGPRGSFRAWLRTIARRHRRPDHGPSHGLATRPGVGACRSPGSVMASLLASDRRRSARL